MMKRIISIILLAVLVLGVCACKQEAPAPLREEDVRAISELATLECFYNNVAEYTKEADNIFQVDRTMWIEYEGSAKLGIDASKITIKIIGTNVEITLPEVEVFSTDFTLNKDSYYISEDSWFIKNKITAEEQGKIIAEAQEKMEAEIAANTALHETAKKQAKYLIQNYIEKMGEISGVEYTIQWTN